MKTFFFAGQRNFGNRGCEVLTRTIARILKDHFGEVRIVVPSDDIEADSKQWPEYRECGVEFVVAHEPPYAKIWKVVQALPVPFLKMAGWPFPFPERIISAIESSDALLAIGGDNYSLDYFSLPNALMELDRIAFRCGKPVILCSASLGPFRVNNGFVRAMLRHLDRFSALTIRETLSKTYAESVGLKNIILVPDPGVLLEPQEVNFREIAPRRGERGIVGLNVSPVVAASRFRRSKVSDFPSEMRAFVHGLLEHGYSVLLVPHVIPRDGAARNNDAQYMSTEIMEPLDTHLRGKVRMLPPRFNAAQLKWAISKCDYFVGARMHSTIAALSCAVPTISISYSQKAVGLNLDLFGHTEYVVPTSRLTATILAQKFDRIVAEAPMIRQTLIEKRKEWEARARHLGSIVENAIPSQKQQCARYV
jgi:colanic acid/amylovoran biosynthesis protein